MAILSPLIQAATSLFNSASAQAWGPLLSLCRTGTLSQLKAIRHGKLAVYDESLQKSAHVFGEESEGLPVVALHVHDEKFWVRLALFADMGFAESYMLREVSCSDLTQFFELFILNRESLSNGSNYTSAFSTGLAAMVRRSNNLKNAQLNISAHYDISNAMFEAFLSQDMTYSCPIWLPKSHPQSSVETLEGAQERKLQRFIDNTHLKSTDRVLEIGTGWGSLAIQAAKQTGCCVTSITLSIEQKQLAESRIAQEGLSDKIQVLLCDYRNLEIPPEGPFDKIISIEMLEAVGKEYLDTYFSCINRLLKKEGGIAAFQCITMPEARYAAYASSDDFIRRYIFPGGHLPTVSQLTKSIEVGSAGTLVIDSVENIGPHYAKALRYWRESFLENWESRIKPQLLLEKKNEGAGVLGEEAAEVFRRKWEYYFRYSEAGFRTKTLGDVIITVGREGAVEMMEEVPL